VFHNALVDPPLIVADDNTPRRDATRNVFLIIPFIVKSNNRQKYDVIVVKWEAAENYQFTLQKTRIEW